MTSDSAFEVHPFSLELDGLLSSEPKTNVHVQVVQLKSSQSPEERSTQLQVWLGLEDGAFNHLALAIQDRRNTKEVHSTKVFGPLISGCSVADDVSENLAGKLSKKLQKPVFVSYNCPEDSHTVCQIQAQLFKLVKEHPNAF